VPGGREQFAGAWAVLGLFAFNALFNSILGEELLFRGVLLPRMKAVFGRWDWLANGVLFGVYHLPSRGACSGRSDLAHCCMRCPPSASAAGGCRSSSIRGRPCFLLLVILGRVLGLA